LLQDARVHCEVLKIRSVPHQVRRLPAPEVRTVHRDVRSEEIEPKLIPQDPTVCQARPRPPLEVPAPFRKRGCTDEHRSTTVQLVDVH
jgi:hypothetical protein